MAAWLLHIFPFRYVLLCIILCGQPAASFDTALQRKYRLILGVGPNFGQKELRRAYFRKAQRQHPDKCRPEDAEKCHKAFVFLAEAYESLKEKPRHSRSSYQPRHRPPSEPSESTKFTQDYVAKREVRMAQVAEKTRQRAAEAAAALEKAAKDARIAEEEAIKKRAEERKVEQKEHDGWVKGQNEFWDKWTERQRKKEEQEKVKLARIEAAKKKIAAEMAAAVEDTEEKEIIKDSKAAEQNQSNQTGGHLQPNSTQKKRGQKGAPKKRFNLEDALRTFRDATGGHRKEL